MFIHRASIIFTAYCISHVICSFEEWHNIDFKLFQFKRQRTAKFYELPEGRVDAIVRRGDTFEFSVKLGKNYKMHRVVITMEFATRFDLMSITLPSNNERWKMKQTHNKRSIDVKVKIPGDAPVGYWTLKVAVTNKYGKVEQFNILKNKVIILFNPWSKEDRVYMADEEKLQDYVLNEKGSIFSYNWSNWFRRLWLFNQFKRGVLEAILFLLNRSELPASKRGDPILLARQLSWLVNDDGILRRGVLRGQWKEPYDRFENRTASSPTDWTGSAPILLQYHQTNGLTVAYGQCWVYSGLLTTITRALGIPSRPVTGFGAAHDQKDDLTLDRYLDKNGFIDSDASDGLWNFHVWTSVWMSRRSDLKLDINGGWQDIDGTPQGVHENYLQVGPASLQAVRSTNVTAPYESYFIYTEVNADEVVWKDKQVVSIKKHSVGLAVVTKAFDSEDLEDLTAQYKAEERTLEERESYKLAAKRLNLNPVSLRPSLQQRANKKAVTVQISAVKEAKLGAVVPISILLRNPSFSDLVVDFGIKVTSIYYRGHDGSVILTQHMPKLKVPGNQVKKFEYILHPDDYIDKLKDFYTNRIEAVVIHKNGYIERAVNHLAFLSPPLKVDCPETAIVGDSFNLIAEFTNPLDRKLLQCYFIVEGQRIERRKIRVNDVEPSDTELIKLSIRAEVPWFETIVVSFVSKSLHEIKGVANIHILAKPFR